MYRIYNLSSLYTDIQRTLNYNFLLMLVLFNADYLNSPVASNASNVNLLDDAS